MNRAVVGQASRLPLGRLAPGFVAGETPAKTAGTAAPLLPRARSWSQCAHTMTWGLSMNLKTLALILKGLRVSGSWSQCMRKKTERGLSMNHGSGAAVPPAAGASRPRIYRGRDARAGSRDGCPATERRFMVPMRAQKRKEALHEANALGKRRRRGVFIGRAIQRIVLNTCPTFVRWVPGKQRG